MTGDDLMARYMACDWKATTYNDHTNNICFHAGLLDAQRETSLWRRLYRVALHLPMLALCCMSN